MALMHWGRSSKVRTALLFDSHQISIFDDVQKQQITGFQWKTVATFVRMDSLGSEQRCSNVAFHYIVKRKCITIFPPLL
jgi:hypothetical protein